MYKSAKHTEFELPPDSELLVHTNEPDEYVPFASVTVSLKDRFAFLLTGKINIAVQEGGRTRLRLEHGRVRDLPLRVLDWWARRRPDL